MISQGSDTVTSIFKCNSTNTITKITRAENGLVVNAQHNILKTYAILVYGHVDILWTYQGAKIKILIFFMISASLCRFNVSCTSQDNARTRQPII